jgi:hypothetical protein
MVVPNKVKIIGYKSDQVDEAEEEFGYIKDKIRFIPVANNGRQIYQSKIFKNLLKTNSVEIVKVLNKYYIWYEEGIPDPTEVLRKVLDSTTHRIMQLDSGLTYYQQRREAVELADVAHGEIENQRKTSAVFELKSQVKATIFDKFVAKEINQHEKREERQVELS